MKISRSKLIRLMKAFRGRRLGVVGDLMLDRYVWGKASRLSPEAPVPVVDFVKEETVPGGAGNVAANLAALGARAFPYGVAGEDEFGKALLQTLKAAKLTGSGILADAERKTTVKTRIIGGHQQVVRVDRETREPLSGEMEERLIRRVMSGLRSFQAIVISDYDKGVVTEEVSKRVLAACQRLRVPALVKPRWSREFAYPGATAIVLNRGEAGFRVGDTLDSEESVEEAGWKLQKHFGCPVVIITRGERGMGVFEEGAHRGFHIPAVSQDTPHGALGHTARASGRQVFDVTGAGDTVLAVLALAWAAGASPREAAVLANVAAGVVVGKLGTATLTPAELLAAVRELG